MSKSKSKPSFALQRTAIGAALATLIAAPALAEPVTATTLPTGGRLVAGDAGLQQAGTTLTVTQRSARAILNWDAFSIGSGASVQFVQPDAGAVALNRVVGSAPSVIDGRLTSNGQVFLVNPHGVVFGKTARADVQGLVASTLDIGDEDFLGGRFRFQAGSKAAAVHNGGELRGGYVALLAPEVRNEGAIVARRGGTVALAAGEAVRLELTGEKLVDVAVDAASIATLASNNRLIQADDGHVIIAARSAYGLLGSVINTGQIAANGIDGDGGSIRLVASQDLTLSGALAADAGNAGRGGSITAIAELANPASQARVSAQLSAQGGRQSGDGGFIETSASRLEIGDAARVDTRAARGQVGQWLLDPVDFTVAASGGDISSSALSAALNSSSVTIDTTGTAAACTGASCGTGSAGAGDININAALSWSKASTGTTLTLKAARNININADITVGSVDYGSTTTSTSTYDHNCHCYVSSSTTVRAASNESLVLAYGQGGNGGGYKIGAGAQIRAYDSGSGSGSSGGWGKVYGPGGAAIAASGLAAGFSSSGYQTELLAYVFLSNAAFSSTYGTAPVLSWTLKDAGGQTLTLAGQSGTPTWSTSLDAATGAGSYSLAYTGGLSASGVRFLAAPAVSWTVNKAPLTITASKTYTGSALFDNGNSTFSVSGLLNADSSSGLSFSFRTSSANAGSYDASQLGSFSFSGLGNYTPVFGATITPAPLTVTATRKFSDGTLFSNANSSFSVSGLVNGDSATGLSFSFDTASANVGSYGASQLSHIVSSGLGNYAPVFNASITPAPLTLTASRTYNGQPSFGTTAATPATAGFDASQITVSGKVGQAALPTLSGSAAVASSDAGVYDRFVSSSLVLSGGNANYTLDGASVRAEITKGSLQLFAAPVQLVQGTQASAVTYSYGVGSPAFVTVYDWAFGSNGGTQTGNTAAFVRSSFGNAALLPSRAAFDAANPGVISGEPIVGNAFYASTTLPGTYPVFALQGSLTAKNYELTLVPSLLQVYAQPTMRDLVTGVLGSITHNDYENFLQKFFYTNSMATSQLAGIVKQIVSAEGYTARAGTQQAGQLKLGRDDLIARINANLKAACPPCTAVSSQTLEDWFSGKP